MAIEQRAFLFGDDAKTSRHAQKTRRVSGGDFEIRLKNGGALAVVTLSRLPDQDRDFGKGVARAGATILECFELDLLSCGSL